MKYLFLLPLLLMGTLFAQTTELTVNSRHLNRPVAVTVLSLGSTADSLPIVYVTDGQKAIDYGLLDELRRLTQVGEIPPAHYAFVSTIDAAGTDHRNDYFFCNPAYLTFFTEEVLPTVESQLNTDFKPADRTLLGISFGGLNAAYFAGQDAPFCNYGLLSPVTYPSPELPQHIAFGPQQGQRFFLSSGTNDAERYVTTLQQLYATTSHTVETLQTAGAHDFDNWRGQLGKALFFLLKKQR